MHIKNILAALSTQNLGLTLSFMRDVQSVTRFYFISAAQEAGLLEALRTPMTQEDLIQKLKVQRPELLAALLETGLALGELACHKGVYQVKGQRALAVIGEQGDIWAALIEAGLTYYYSVYQHCAERMRGAPLGDYLKNIGELVARVSKADEPFNRRWLADLIADHGALRILDVGCGSGIYLKDVAEANPGVSGVGIDIDPAVVQQAQRNLQQWKLAERFKVLVADIQAPPAELNGTFDVITLLNLLYYFPESERTDLFRRLRERLSPNGQLAIVNTVRGKGHDVLSANLNMATSSMIGCTPLPDLDQTLHQLQASGFPQVQTTQLIPGISAYGIVAQCRA